MPPFIVGKSWNYVHILINSYISFADLHFLKHKIGYKIEKKFNLPMYPIYNNSLQIVQEND